MVESRKPYTAADLTRISAREHVRQRPAMYVGDTTVNGLHFMVGMTVYQSLACVGSGLSIVSVALHSDGTITIKDDGLGFANDKCERTSRDLKREVSILEVAMTSFPCNIKNPRFGTNHWSYYGGNASIANFLSEVFEVTSHHEGKSYRQTYHQGEPTGPVTLIGQSDQQGLTATFKPDAKIFKSTSLNADRMRRWLQQMAFLHAGIRVQLEVANQVEEFFYNDGLTAYVEHHQAERMPLHNDIIRLSGESEGIMFDIAFQYAEDTKEITHSFVNAIASFGFPADPNDGGSHVHGFWVGLRRSLEDYSQATPNAIPANATHPDFFDGLTAVISTRLPQPTWLNAMRSQLDNAEVEATIQNSTYLFLANYWRKNPATADKILTKVRNAVEKFERSEGYHWLTDIDMPSGERESDTDEDEHLVSLPDMYSARLHRSNGGYIYFSDGTRWRLLPLYDELDDQATEPPNHVIKQTLQARRLPNFPERAIVIGQIEMGDLLVVLPSPYEPWWKYQEEAFRWSRETGDLAKMPDSLSDCEPRLPVGTPYRW